jgi:hypothetical protein
MFFQLTDADKASRGATVERFMRKQGGQLGLSHDETLKAIAVAEDMEVFPPLKREGKQLLAKLRS